LASSASAFELLPSTDTGLAVGSRSGWLSIFGRRPTIDHGMAVSIGHARA
jgi:hypothetical protein